MKPNWKDAPSWANYLAMDSSGEWFWFEKKPHIADSVWDSEGPCKFAGFSSSGWEKSREERPDGQNRGTKS